MGDYLTQAPADGGGLFLVVIVATLTWFTVQQRRADSAATTPGVEGAML